ncbi:hypothetical protein [Blastomonas sp. UPD001]|nr:hypothetical protein [Blastomonas sp. UPD001]
MSLKLQMACRFSAKLTIVMTHEVYDELDTLAQTGPAQGPD